MPPPITIPRPEANTDDTGDAKDSVKGTSFIAYAFYACLIIILLGFPSLFYWGNGQYDAGVRDGAADKAKVVQQYYENWQLDTRNALQFKKTRIPCS